jgi:poly(A) polymerase
VTELKPAWSLPSADWLSRPETQAVFGALEAAGHQVRAVGGAVRNSLLGRAVADVDMATAARPGQTMAAASAAGLTVIATGLQHGTVTVVSGGIPHEVTTLRADVATDGRHATVAFTDDWAADASRRDLTVNALYCDRHGVVFDPLGGRADLEARRVRFIGDPAARIREDYLRILRFFRFHAEYAVGAPDPEGVAASVQERAGLARLSGERIHHELRRLLVAPGAAGVVETMADSGLLTELLPVVPRLSTFQRLLAIDTAQQLAPDATLRLAALLVGVYEDAVRLHARLKLSVEQREWLVEAANAVGQPFGMAEADLRLRLFEAHRTNHGGIGNYARATLLAWARAGTRPEATAWRTALALPERWRPPTMPVRGADVIALGVPPGPRVGLILSAFSTWWIAANFPADQDLVGAKLAEITRIN